MSAARSWSGSNHCQENLLLLLARGRKSPPSGGEFKLGREPSALLIPYFSES